MKNKNLNFARQPDFTNQIKKIYEKSTVFQLEKLLRKEKKIKAKIIYSQNNLEKIRKKINKMSLELAQKEGIKNE